MEQAIYLNIDYTNITHYFEIIYKAKKTRITSRSVGFKMQIT